MSVLLKNYPNVLEDWFKREYEHIPLNTIHFSEETVNQDELNPYHSQIIFVFKKEQNNTRIRILGFFRYGDHLQLNPIGISLNIRALEKDSKKSKKPFQYVFKNGDVSLDIIKKRIEWIVYDNGKTTPLAETEPAFMVLLHIAPYRKDFYTKFLKTEEDYLYRRLSDFNEESMYNFLKLNGFLSLLKSLEQPTVYDYQSVYPKVCPTIWFDIPIEEIPTDISNSLCLYSGGRLHIPCVDMAPWVWRKVTTIHRQVSDHPEQIYHLFGYINDIMKPKRKRQKITVEFEDRFTPCVKNALFGKKFPQDQDRQHLVRILSYANVPLEYIGEKLDILNEKYPHKNGDMKTKRRWDYESHYKAKYHPPKCEKMNCPLAPGKGMDVKKSTCLKMFMEKFPDEKIPNPKSFYGPHSWFDW